MEDGKRRDADCFLGSQERGKGGKKRGRGKKGGGSEKRGGGRGKRIKRALTSCDVTG